LTFLNPILLSIGLGCVAIPIIIHILMRRRRRPVAWGAMKFLLEAYRRQRRRMNLEQILLLASRCLLVALLALAVGKPVLGAARSLLAGPRTLYLVVDNSITSTARATTNAPGAGTSVDDALARSKAAATDLISKLDAAKGDRVAIIAAASPADPVVFPPSSDLAGARDALKELAPADSRADFVGSLALVRDELLGTRSRSASEGEGASSNSSASNSLVAVLSEFRAGSADPSTTLPALDPDKAKTMRVFALAPAGEGVDNVAIVGLEPLRSLVLSGDASSRASGIDVPVRVTLRRFGPGTSAAAVSRVSVSVAFPGGGAAATNAVGDVRWSPSQENAQIVVSASAPTRASDRTTSRIPLVITASIDNDAILADNTFRRTIDTRDRLEVVILTTQQLGQATTIDSFRAEDWLALAISPAEDLSQRRQSGDVRVTTIDPLQASSMGRGLSDYDVLVVPRPDLLDIAAWRGLRAAADAGSLVLVTPPTSVQTHLWTDGFTEAMGLEWSFAREARVIEPRMPLSADRPTPSGPDLLELVAAEIPELAKPVTVAKLLAPTTGGTSPTSNTSANFDVLLKLADGTPFVISASPPSNTATVGGKPDSASPRTTPITTTAPATSAASNVSAQASTQGLVVYIAASLDLSWTDLPTKPLMVPLIQELVRQGVGRSGGPHSALAGGVLPLPPNAADLSRLDAGNDPQGPSVVSVAGAGNAGSAQAGPIAPSLRRAGVWGVRNASGNSLGVLAINADTAGSSTDPRTRDELARWFTPIAGEAISWIDPASVSPESGVPTAASAASPVSMAPRELPPISFPLLIAAGVMALIELALSRFFSHARADQWTAVTPVSTASTPSIATRSTTESNAA
jgi:hypothetical protein